MTLASGQTSRNVVGIATQRHQQRHEGHERTEDEGEYEQRAQRRQQRPEQDARAAALVVTGRSAQSVKPRHFDRCSADGDAGERGLRGASLFLARVDAALRRDVDEREGGAAIVGDERAITRRGKGGGHRLRQHDRDLRERRIELVADARRVDGRTGRQLHDRDDRRDIAAAAVDRSELLVRLEALPPRNVELLRESAARRPDRCERGDRDEKPSAEDDPLVRENPAGQRGQRAAARVLGRHGNLAMRARTLHG